MNNILRTLLGIAGLSIFGISTFMLGTIYGEEKEQKKMFGCLKI